MRSIATILVGLVCLANVSGANSSSPWQQDSYVNIHSGTGACLVTCFAVSSFTESNISSDSTVAHVEAHDLHGLPIPIIVRFVDIDGTILEEEVGCGAMYGIAIPATATHLVLGVSPLQSQLACGGVQATAGYFLLRMDGSWQPQGRPCTLPFDEIFEDPDCA